MIPGMATRKRSMSSVLVLALFLAGCTDINDAKFLELETMSGLELLDVRRTRIREATVAALRAALPACEIRDQVEY